MKVGFVGLGKLGLPLALAFEKRGHEVFGCDRRAAQRGEEFYREDEKDENGEPLWKYFRETSKIEFLTFEETARRADFLMVVVGTPSAQGGVGENRTLACPYDMSKVTGIIRDLRRLQYTKPVVIGSTCTPGYLKGTNIGLTFPLLHVPQFCAMGTAVRDTLDPEFVVIGADDSPEAVEMVTTFYGTLHSAPIRTMTLTEAELTKTTYNGTVMWKINYVNAIARLADEIGDADVDVITSTLALSTRRIFAPTYWRAGGGDGGPCHPKENAMLADFVRAEWMSDPWADNMRLRLSHTDWVAGIVDEVATDNNLPVVIVGKGFKRDNPVPDHGWPLLLYNTLEDLGHKPTWYDEVTRDVPPLEPAVYIIAMDHSFVSSMVFPEGSVVVDPWGVVGPQAGVEVRRPGRDR